MHQSAVVSSQGPGTGLYSHQSSTSQKSRNKRRDGSSTNGQTKHQMEDTHAREREELIALRLEYSAQGQLVEMLSTKVNKMTTIVETSKLSSREMVSVKCFLLPSNIYYRQSYILHIIYFFHGLFFFFLLLFNNTQYLQERQLVFAQEERSRANKMCEESKLEDTVVSDQLACVRDELEEECEKRRSAESEIGRGRREIERMSLEVQKFREKSVQKERTDRASDASLQEMHGVNAGLRRQLSDEQARIVGCRGEVRAAQSEVQRVYVELSTRESELIVKNEQTNNLEKRIMELEEEKIKMKEKYLRVSDQLGKALDVRKTAVRRAEITELKARKMSSEVAHTERTVEDYETKVENLIGQITMKERRIQLMKKQHTNEIIMHKATKTEREHLEKEIERLSRQLDLAESALNQRALQVVRGGPVLEGEEDPMLRDSLEEMGNGGGGGGSGGGRNGFKPITMSDAMRMGGGGGRGSGKSTKQASQHPVPQRKLVQFKRNQDKQQMDVFSAPPPAPSDRREKKKEGQKKSRKENLMMIRKMTSNMPDAAKLPGSDAPAWMQDDGADIM